METKPPRLGIIPDDPRDFLLRTKRVAVYDVTQSGDTCPLNFVEGSYAARHVGTLLTLSLSLSLSLSGFLSAFHRRAPT